MANYFGSLAEMEGGFGCVTKSSAGSLLLFFHMQPNGMQLDQMLGYTAWFLQTCFDNLRKENPEVWRVNDDIESCRSNGQQTTNLPLSILLNTDV